MLSRTTVGIIVFIGMMAYSIDFSKINEFDTRHLLPIGILVGFLIIAYIIDRNTKPGKGNNPTSSSDPTVDATSYDTGSYDGGDCGDGGCD